MNPKEHHADSSSMSKELGKDPGPPLSVGDLAAATLGHLAGNAALLTAFLDATGLRPEQLRAGAADGTLDRALLHHLGSDDRLLVAVAAALGRSPEAIAAMANGSTVTACRAEPEAS
jgi:Protein of unknown function (DUF3572)